MRWQAEMSVLSLPQPPARRSATTSRSFPRYWRTHAPERCTSSQQRPCRKTSWRSCTCWSILSKSISRPSPTTAIRPLRLAERCVNAGLHTLLIDGDLREAAVIYRLRGLRRWRAVCSLLERAPASPDVDELGVDRIEAGFPRVSQDDWDAVKLISAAGLKAQVWGFSRAVPADLESIFEVKLTEVMSRGCPSEDGALGRYRYDTDPNTCRVPAWELMPGVHWQLSDNWWMAAGLLLPMKQQAPYDAFWGARYAIVEDPDGNAVGLMSPIDPDRRTAPPSSGPAGTTIGSFSAARNLTSATAC